MLCSCVGFRTNASMTRERVSTKIRKAAILVAILHVSTSLMHSQTSMQSVDAYVRREGSEWILGTSAVEKRIRLTDGRFVLASLRNKKSRQEYQNGGHPPAEIRFVANGQDVGAPNWHWTI